MHRREVVRRIEAASEQVQREISGHSAAFGGGMSGEGYSGGYRDALSDVLLMLSSDCVPRRRQYWREETQYHARSASPTHPSVPNEEPR